MFNFAFKKKGQIMRCPPDGMLYACVGDYPREVVEQWQARIETLLERKVAEPPEKAEVAPVTLFQYEDAEAILRPMQGGVKELREPLEVFYEARYGPKKWKFLPRGTKVRLIGVEEPAIFLDPWTKTNVPIDFALHQGKVVVGKDIVWGRGLLERRPWINTSYLLEVDDINNIMADARDRTMFDEVEVRSRMLELLHSVRPDLFELIERWLDEYRIRLDEQWWRDSNLMGFVALAKGIWSLMGSTVSLVAKWMRKGYNTVRDLAGNLDRKAEQLRGQGIVEARDWLKVAMSRGPGVLGLGETEVMAPIFKRRAEERRAKLKEMGKKMADVLIRSQTQPYTDKSALAVFLDVLEIPNLAALLRRHLPRDLSDEELRTVGYWLLKDLSEDLRKNYDQRLPVAAYIQGTVHNDIKKLLGLGYRVHASRRYHPDAADLSNIMLGPQMKVFPIVVQDFSWLSSDRDRGFWVWTHKDHIDFVIEELPSLMKSGAVAKTLQVCAKAIDKRRKREVFFIFGELAFGGAEDAPTMAYMAMRESDGVADAYPSLTFKGFHVISVDGEVHHIIGKEGF